MLLEFMLAVALVALMAGSLIPYFESTHTDLLRGAAQECMSQLARARQLAVSNNSKYQLTFQTAANTVVLTHSGTNTSLNTLPQSPYRDLSEAGTQETLHFDTLSSAGICPALLGAAPLNATTASRSSIEFGPLGETTDTDDTMIWFSVSGRQTHYLSLRVSAVTGLCTLGTLQVTAPFAATAVVIH